MFKKGFAFINSFLFWIVLILEVYLIIGIETYPTWWHELFFEQGYSTLSVWLQGISWLARYLTINQPVLVIVIIYIFMNKSIRERLGVVFYRLKISSLANVIIIFALFGVGYYQVNNLPNNEQVILHKDLLKQMQEIKKLPSLTKREKDISFEPPIDFIFLNSNIINGLYDQIAPDLSLKESVVETRSLHKKEVKIATENIRLGASSSQQEGKKDKFIAYEKTDILRAREVFKYLYGEGKLEVRDTLDSASEDLAGINKFKEIAEKNEIKFDLDKYKAVFDKVLKNTLRVEEVKFKALNSYILVKGDFKIGIANSSFVLEHDYYNEGNEYKIIFSTHPISTSSPHVKSELFKMQTQDKTSFNFNVVGRARTTTQGEKLLKIIIEPYAIW